MTSELTPRFKYFKESGEEEYHSFLGVPLIDRGVLQGVLVVQTKEARIFREDEIRMLVEAANQVAPVVSEARTLDRFIAPAQERLWALGAQSLVELGPGLHQPVPRSESDALAATESESHLAAQRDSSGGDRAPRHGTGSA